MPGVCDVKLTQDLLQTYTSLQRRTVISGCAAAGKVASGKALRGAGGYCDAATMSGGSHLSWQGVKFFLSGTGRKT